MPSDPIHPPAGDSQPAAGDPRFSVGLLVDVGQVLEAHGYDRLNGGQLIELQAHLLHLLHGTPGSDCMGGVA